MVLKAGSLELLLHNVSHVGADLRLAGTVFEVIAKVAIHDSLKLLPLLEKISRLVFELVDLLFCIVARWVTEGSNYP